MCLVFGFFHDLFGNHGLFDLDRGGFDPGSKSVGSACWCGYTLDFYRWKVETKVLDR